MQQRIGQKRERKTKSRSLKSVGIGLSRYAAAANPHSLSTISGASGADTKKLGTNRKRFATCSGNEEVSLALSTGGALGPIVSVHRVEPHTTIAHMNLKPIAVVLQL